jgi:hypothetical protein
VAARVVGTDAGFEVPLTAYAEADASAGWWMCEIFAVSTVEP